jgi:hypothetical protein
MRNKIMTADRGPLCWIEYYGLKGTNRRIKFIVLEDSTIAIKFKTLVDRKKRIISYQNIRLSEEAALMVLEGITDAIGLKMELRRGKE